MKSMFLVAKDTLDCREGDIQLVLSDLWYCVCGELCVWIILCVVV